jgi:hypothetical protein
MTKWEYKTVKFERKGLFSAKIDVDAELNRLGEDGWEMISLLAVGAGGMAGSSEFIATFKRPKA